MRPQQICLATLRSSALALCATLFVSAPGRVLAALSEAAPAAETPPGDGVEFIWDAPEGCPGEQEVTQRVRQLLAAQRPQAQRDEAAPGVAEPHANPVQPRRVSVIARVRREPDGIWDMRLFVVTPEVTRERSLRHARCDLLAETTAVVVALAVDPHAAGTLDAEHEAVVLAEADKRPSATPEPKPVTKPPAQQQPTKTQDRSPEPATAPPKKRPRGFVRALGGIGLGVLPSYGGGLDLSAGVLWQRLRIEAGARYWFPRTARLAPPNDDAGANVSMFTANVRACPVLALKSIELPLCGGLAIGQVVASPFGLNAQRQGRRVWAAVSFMPMLQWSPVRWLALSVAAEGFLALTRPAFEVGSQGVVHRVGVAGLRAMSGVEFRFP